MRTDLFDFDLPEGNIALRPARPRDSARLLHVTQEGAFADRVVRELPSLFTKGEVLVLNDSRVIPVALEGVRPARPNGEDVAVKINLIERLGGDLWLGFARPGRRLRVGDEILIGEAGALRATVLGKAGDGTLSLRFDRFGDELDQAFQRIGRAPLPPYIAERRAYETQDAEDYQTVYAVQNGSVAAPTAGLHFTPSLLSALADKGVQIVSVRLHVGAGTFLPVKSDDVHGHLMHAEHFEISDDAARAINAAKNEGRLVTAIGTTSLRALESAAQDGRVIAVARNTSIFITPGYRFQIVDRLMTNFHLPRSTLFMLVCAFAGLDRMQSAYSHAIAKGYRFYSYGDSSLLERAHG